MIGTGVATLCVDGIDFRVFSDDLDDKFGERRIDKISNDTEHGLRAGFDPGSHVLLQERSHDDSSSLVVLSDGLRSEQSSLLRAEEHELDGVLRGNPGRVDERGERGDESGGSGSVVTRSRGREKGEEIGGVEVGAENDYGRIGGDGGGGLESGDDGRLAPAMLELGEADVGLGVRRGNLSSRLGQRESRKS